MLEIRERISVKDVVTGVYSTDNYGNGNDFTDNTYTGVPPHQVLKHMQFSYSGDTKYREDGQAYLDAHRNPEVSYEVRFKDLRYNDRYKDWMALQTLNVGDTGTVKCGVLGIDVQQKIISRTINDITGETESITLGNFMPNMFRSNKYSNLIARDSSSSRRLNALEALNRTP